jgi:hypothetical protein
MVLSILLDRSQYAGKERQRVRKTMMRIAQQQELVRLAPGQTQQPCTRKGVLANTLVVALLNDAIGRAAHV